MDPLVRFGAGRGDTEADRVEPGARESADRGRHGPVRLEVDGAAMGPLSDPRDRGLDHPRYEERLPFACATERDLRPAAFEVGGGEIDDLLGGRMECRTLGRHRIAVERDECGWMLVRRGGDGQRAVRPGAERVRRGAAAEVLRAACELTHEPVRRARAQSFGDPRRDPGVRPMVERGRVVNPAGRDLQRPALVRGHGGVRPWREVRHARRDNGRGVGKPDVSGRQHRSDREAPGAERARGARSVEAERTPVGERNQRGAVRERDVGAEGPRRRPVEHGRAVIGGEDDTSGAVGMDGGEHLARIGLGRAADRPYCFRQSRNCVPRLHSQWTWGPVVTPLRPIAAMTWPRETSSPTFTKTLLVW